jgi:hypothetical protein
LQSILLKVEVKCTDLTKDAGAVATHEHVARLSLNQLATRSRADRSSQDIRRAYGDKEDLAKA